jgi:hypothetical protein
VWVVGHSVNAITDAGALCEVLGERDVVPELCDDAARVSATLFLGKRLIETNLEELRSRCEPGCFTATNAVAGALGHASDAVVTALARHLDDLDPEELPASDDERCLGASSAVTATGASHGR